MRNISLRRTRGMLVLLVALLGFMGLTASPVGAQLQPGEGCAPEGDRFILSLVDPTPDDGVISITDLRTIANGLPAGEQKDTFNRLIAQAETQGVTGIRYNLTGPCPPPATTAPATNTPVPATSVPATNTPVPATTAPGTATTVPATTVPGTATTVPATTVPGTATATTVPGTETATAPATSVPATTAPDDDGDDDGGVTELPDTGQGSTEDQSNATLVMLLGGMALCIVGAFLWIQRRAA